MKQTTISVTPAQFKSPLVPCTVLFYALSALLALAGIGLLFDPEFAALLVQDRIAGGIQLGSSLRIWYLIDTVITLLSFLCPVAMVTGLSMILRGRFVPGMRIVNHVFQWLLWIVYGTSIAALGLFVFKMARSILFYLPFNEAAYLIYSLLITEGLMGVQAWLIYRLIRKFLRDSCDCSLSIAYTLTSCKLDSVPIPSFPALGLGILGCVQLYLAWDRAFTLTIVKHFVQDYYQLLPPTHYGQILAAATLATGALGNFLLSFYLRRYNRVCERTRFQATRLK